MRASDRARTGRGGRLLVLDAFSSDAIPMHLLTREAFATIAGFSRPGAAARSYLQPLPRSQAGCRRPRPTRAAGARLRPLRSRERPESEQRNPLGMGCAVPSAATMSGWSEAAPAVDAGSNRAPGFAPWTDDHASVLPLIKWTDSAGARAEPRWIALIRSRLPLVDRATSAPALLIAARSLGRCRPASAARSRRARRCRPRLGVGLRAAIAADSASCAAIQPSLCGARRKRQAAPHRRRRFERGLAAARLRDQLGQPARKRRLYRTVVDRRRPARADRSPPPPAAEATGRARPWQAAAQYEHADQRTFSA